ncbi:MAG: hypothetical protein ABIH38_04755 [Patescibacteria group bacterium]
MRDNYQAPPNIEKAEEQLPKDESLDPKRAKMVRAQAGIGPENRIYLGYKEKASGLEPVFREATPEDYAQAIEVIDELEKQAKEEPAIKEALMHFARLTERARYILIETLKFPGELLQLLSSASGGIDFSEGRAKEHKIKLEENLKTARMKLKELKRKAEEFEPD